MSLTAGSNENPSEYNVETDTFTLKPPVKEGYTFKGFTGSNGDVPQVIVTIEKGSLGDRTYTANWEVKSYSVTYELDGGSLPEGVKNPSSYTMFTEDFTLNAPTKTGYTFIGWTGSNGETPELNVTVSKGSSGNRTYTANWGEETYTVTYDLNGGALAEGEENPTEYSLNSDDFTLINPTTKRLEFMGWTGSNGDVPELNVTVPKGTSGNLTYKANWVCATFTDGTKLTYDQLRLPENGTKYGYKAEYLKENSISETSSVRTGIFYGCSTIKTLDFPDSVKTLNAYRSETFARASSLERVSFSDDINVKNNYISFESCSKLNDVKLPENCSGYFWYCTSIESVGPKGSGADCELKVETLGENMFYGCTSLKKLEIPEGTKTIMFRCFRYCPIEEIIYPEGMENVDGGAFDASYVKHVYIPKSMTKMANMGFYGASYGDYGPNVAYEEFIYHDFNMRTAGPAGNGYDVEYEWDTEIPDSIFVNTYMNILHIPNTITKIGTYNLPKGCFCVDYDGTLAEWNAIDKAKNWDNNKINYGHIYNYYVVCNDGVIDRNGVTDYIIDNGVIYNPDKTELVYVKPDVQIEKLVIPETVKSIRKNAFKFNFGVTELVMPDSIAELEDYTIAQAYALKKITLSSNTTKIKKGVLFNCVELEEITLPDKVTSVGYKAFSECNALKRVILNDGLKSIDSGALRKNNSLEYVRIPASVETIGGGVFDYSPLLKTAGPIGGEYNIEFGWTDKIPNNAFNSSVVNANVLESITIPETITEIGARAFQNTTKLGEVNFPDAISKIGLSAFYCSGISGRVELPSSLTEMGNEAFSGCSRMTSVVIPSGITEINADVFSGDSELTEVNFEDSNNLTRICESAFSGDSKLTAINLPESLSVIESRAFSGDSSLDGLYIPAGVNLIYEDAFSEVPNLHYHGRAEYGPWGQASDYTENSTVTANVAPTCTTDGYTDVTYDCGYAEHTVLPAQHNYVDYVCSVCGKSIENSVRKIKSGVIYDFVEEKNTLWASIWKSNNDVPGDERMHSTSTWMVDSDGSLIMDWTVFGNGGEDSSLDITIDGELVLAGVSGDKNGSFRISKGSHTVTASYKNSADEDDGSLNGARIIFELNPDDYVNKSEKVLDSGDVNYQFTEVNGQPGTWRSNNAEQTSTSAVTTWELVSDGTLEVEWNVSGSKYDSFSLTLDTYTKKVNGVTGDRSGKFTLSAGKHTLVAAYKRNTTTTDGFTNAATVKFNSPDGSSNSVTKREELDNYGFRQYNDGWLCDFQQYNKTAVSTWRVASNGYFTIEWKVIDTNGSDPLKIYVDDKLEVDYEGWAGGSGYILLPRGEHVVRAEYEFNSMNSGGGDRAFIKFVDNDATTMGNKVEYNDEGSANEGYKFVADGNVWTSDNQYIYNSVALSEWSVNSDGNMSIAWTVSSSEWDTLTVELDGTKVVDAESGDNNGSFTVPSGTHILKAMYSKTDYGEDLEDTATITFNYSEGSTNSYTNTSNGLTLGFEEVDGVWTSNNGAYANSSATAKWNVRSNGGLHIKYSSLGEEYDSFIIYIDGDEHFCNANETGLIDIPSGDHTITAEYIISEKGDKWAKIEFVSDADYPTVGNITNYCDNTSNASDYFFAEENGIWRSNNAGQASTQAESEWTVGSDGTMNIYWNISAGSADKLILYVDGEKAVSESGEASDAISLSYGIHKVKAVYEKGSSGSSGSDCAVLRFSNEAPQTPDGEVVTNTGNGSNYYFEQGSNGTWASNNDGKEASSATSSWKINSNGTAKINWSLNNDDTSFGANDYYGCFTLYVDGQIEVYRATGTESGVIELPEGVHSVRAIYEKRSNYYNPGDDKAYIRFTYTRNTTPGETTENSITNTDNGDYKFVEEPEKTWTSNNKNVNSSEAMSEWKVVSDGTVKLNWSVSSESSYDKLSIYVDNDEVVSAASGTNSGEITFEEGEHTVKAVYSKDGSSSSGDDCAKLSFSVALPQEPVDNSVTNNSNGSNYYFVGQEKVWTSNNKGVSSSQAVSEWEVGSDGTLKINWTVSSETNYDKLTIYVDGTEAVSAKSGIDSGTITIPAGKHTVKAVYLKDSSQDGNDDQAVLTFVY